MKAIFELVFLLCLLCCFIYDSKAQDNVHLNYKQNQTPTYQQTIEAYTSLSASYPETSKLVTYGKTDVGKPLHVFQMTDEVNIPVFEHKRRGKIFLLINNAIHPGEPCGVDASLKLAKTILKEHSSLLKDVVVCIIPFYNIGGGLNRGKYSRANQNGPLEYGFRGNAKNLDLNRDFIKLDSWNAKTFCQIFQKYDPDIFIDTHTTNGSNFQYTLSLITTQRDKLHPVLSKYLDDFMLPSLYTSMKDKKCEMIPYVNLKGKTPSSGIIDYLETPRYSTGYAALFHSIGFVTEALKYKPFEDRVEQTYQFLLTVSEYAEKNKKEIKQVREKAKKETLSQDVFPITWDLDTTRFDKIPFLGYQVKYRKSRLTGDSLLYYDESEPLSQEVNYYRYFSPDIQIKAPFAYVIPQAYSGVIDRLLLNQVEMHEISKDTIIYVETYYIDDYSTTSKPYEAHYLHSDVKVRKLEQPIQFNKGDIVIFLNQERKRFVIEILEPQATDSYFNWNFFDCILQQKEWFNANVFEDIAIEYLESDPKLKAEFEAMKAKDSEFASNHWLQVYFLYKHTPHYESTHNLYPVARVHKTMKLPIMPIK